MLKKLFSFKVFVALLALFNMISCLMLFFFMGKQSQIKQTSIWLKEYTKIQVQVLEETTLKPIDNATVCVVENRHYENTNIHGRTSYITVPIKPNNNFDISYKRNYGEITLLVYKSGYADYLSFYNIVKSEQTKVGIIIKLRPIVNLEDLKPTITMNFPDSDWCENLIKLYKKDFNS